MNEPGLKLDLTLPGVPPNINKTYVNMARGKTLSKIKQLYHNQERPPIYRKRRSE
jgi:hypothetical protein